MVGSEFAASPSSIQPTSLSIFFRGVQCNRSFHRLWIDDQQKSHLIQVPTGVDMATNHVPLTGTSVKMLDSYTTHRKTTALVIEVKLHLVLHLSSSHTRLTYKFCQVPLEKTAVSQLSLKPSKVNSKLIFRRLSFRTPYPASYSFCSSRKSLVSSDLIAPAARILRMEGLRDINLTYASDAEQINFAIQYSHFSQKMKERHKAVLVLWLREGP